jgi:hypothetical protein
MANESAAPFPHVKWTVAAPLGVDDRLVELVEARAENAISHLA